MNHARQPLSVLLVTCLLAQAGIASAQKLSPEYDIDDRYLVGITAKGHSGTDATVWSVQDGSVVRRFAHQESIVHVELAPNGKGVLTSSFLPPNELSIRSKDDSIRLWDLPSGKELLKIRNATHGQFSRDGKRIYGLSKRTGSKSNGLTFDVASWDSKTGKRLFTAKLPNDGATLSSSYTLQESAGSSMLLFYGQGSAVVYDSITGRLITQPFRAFSAFGVLGLLTPRGDEVHVAESRHVRYMSTATNAEIKKVTFPLESAWWVGLHPKGQGFAAVSVYGDLVYYDRNTDRMTQEKTLIKAPGSLFVRPDGLRFFINWGGAYTDGEQVPQNVTAFDPATCKALWQLPGRLIARSGEDRLVLLEWPNKVSIVDALSGKPIRTFTIKGLDLSTFFDAGCVVLKR